MIPPCFASLSYFLFWRHAVLSIMPHAETSQIVDRLNNILTASCVIMNPLL